MTPRAQALFDAADIARRELEAEFRNVTFRDERLDAMVLRIRRALAHAAMEEIRPSQQEISGFDKPA